MPGINVTTAVRTGPTGNGDIVAGQWFVVGEAERGDRLKGDCRCRRGVDGAEACRSAATLSCTYC